MLVSLDESWFSAPAVLDTRSGRVQPLPSDNTSAYVSMAWLPGDEWLHCASACAPHFGDLRRRKNKAAAFSDPL